MKDNFPWKESIEQLSEVSRAYKEVVKSNDLRDYFAAMAMQGLISTCRNESYESTAIVAYKMADTMLKEREK